MSGAVLLLLVWAVQHGMFAWPRASLRGHTGGVLAVAFSPDGNRLASSSYDQTVCVWDVQQAAMQTTLRGYTAPVEAVAFSPAGNLLATASDGDHHAMTGGIKIKVRDACSGEVVGELHGCPGNWVDEVLCLAFTPDVKTLAAGGRDGTLRLWDMTTMQEQARLRVASPILAVAISADGKWLAAGTQDAVVRLWDLETLQEQLILTGHSQQVTGVAFSPDGRLVASASGDTDLPVHPGEVNLWDVVTGQLKRQFRCPDNVTCVSFSPDGRWVAAGIKFTAQDLLEMQYPAPGQIRFWDASTGSERFVWRAHNGGVTCLTFSPDGRTLATGGWDKTVRLWDVPMK